MTTYEQDSQETFVNANYRFLIHPDFRYDIDIVNPDAKINWDFVEQVVVSAANCSNCPVCLSTPVVPRITRCGHILCLSCISQYLEVKPGQYRRTRTCPICMKTIEKVDLRCVTLLECSVIKNVSLKNNPQAQDENEEEEEEEEEEEINGRHIKAGQILEFCLMHRKYNTVFVVPVQENDTPSSSGSTGQSEIPFITTKGALEFSRYVLSTRGHMESEYEREQSTLEMEAIEALSIQSNQLDSLRKCINDISISAEKLGSRYNSSANSMPLANSRASWARGRRREASQVERRITRDYYFHQSVDGQYVFLDPLNISMLRHEFGIYHNFPKNFTTFVISINETVVTEALRKRYKCISHLPLNCNITFALVDLCGVVSNRTLTNFEDRLAKRLVIQPDEEDDSTTDPDLEGTDEEAYENSHEHNRNSRESSPDTSDNQSPREPPIPHFSSSSPVAEYNEVEDTELMNYILRLSAAEYASLQPTNVGREH